MYSFVSYSGLLETYNILLQSLGNRVAWIPTPCLEWLGISIRITSPAHCTNDGQWNHHNPINFQYSPLFQVVYDVSELIHRLSDVGNKMKQNSDDLDHKLQSVSLPVIFTLCLFPLSLFLWFIPLLCRLFLILLFLLSFSTSSSSMSTLLNLLIPVGVVVFAALFNSRLYGLFTWLRLIRWNHHILDTKDGFYILINLENKEINMRKFAGKYKIDDKL